MQTHFVNVVASLFYRALSDGLTSPRVRRMKMLANPALQRAVAPRRKHYLSSIATRQCSSRLASAKRIWERAWL